MTYRLGTLSPFAKKRLFFYNIEMEKILVVEDNKSMQEMLESILSKKRILGQNRGEFWGQAISFQFTGRIR